MPWIRTVRGVKPMRTSYGRSYWMHSDSWMEGSRSTQHTEQLLGHTMLNTRMLMWVKRLDLRIADLQKTIPPTIRATEHTQL